MDRSLVPKRHHADADDRLVRHDLRLGPQPARRGRPGILTRVEGRTVTVPRPSLAPLVTGTAAAAVVVTLSSSSDHVGWLPPGARRAPVTSGFSRGRSGRSLLSGLRRRDSEAPRSRGPA